MQAKVNVSLQRTDYEGAGYEIVTFWQLKEIRKRCVTALSLIGGQIGYRTIMAN
jgi:hypothetical protein